MSDLAASAGLRLTVRGAGGAVDLAVPAGADVESLGREYAAVLGRRVPPVLVTTTGRPLDPARPLRSLGVQPGDVLVALDPAALAAVPAEEEERHPTSAPPSATTFRAHPVLVATAVASGLAAVVAGAQAPPGPSRVVAVAVLMLAALASGFGVPRGGHTPRSLHALAAPSFAGAAGFLLVHSPAAGGGMLALVVGAVGAGVAAAAVRTGADPRTEHLLRIWLVAAGVTALSAAVALALGAPERALWAWLFLVAVVVARLLPYLAVDVPDETLLDIDRLAVTAWSARERPRRGRRRLVIRPRGVAGLIRQGRDLLAAGSVAVAVFTGTTAVLLIQDPGTGIGALGVHLLLFFGGAALALTARSYRAATPRVALRLPAVLALTALAAALLVTVSGSLLWWALTALGLTAFVVVVAAVALGRGWRSVWWARTADVVEGLSVVLCLAAFPVGAGLFELVRQLSS